MSNHSVVEHRASYYYIRIEEDMLAICSKGKCSPHCKALILAILESWMNTKRDRGEGEYIYLTMPQWIKHTYMLYQRNVITDCIHELMEEKLIIRRPIKRYDQNTFEYTLNLDVLNAKIRMLPAKPIKETQPNLDLYIAFRERSKATRVKGKEGVREKSPTLKSRKGVGEKSPTVGDKSQGVGDKSTQHSSPTEITLIDSTERESEPVPERGTNQHPNVSSLSPKSTVEILMDIWDEICGELIPRDRKHKEAAAELARCGATGEDLINCRDFCLKTNPKWYGPNGVDLAAIERNWGKWKSSNKPQKGAQGTQPTTSASTGMTHDEAVQLASHAIQQAHASGITIQAHATSTNDDTWVVKASWNGNKLPAITSQAFWDKYFVELQGHAEDYAAEQEGAR